MFSFFRGIFLMLLVVVRKQYFYFIFLANVAHVLEGEKGNFRNFGLWEIGKILDFFFLG
jgi:hypothetical protein